MKRRHQSGQATVELVAALPLLVLVALALASFLAAGRAAARANSAVEAAAIALLRGGSPYAAARAAVPDAGSALTLRVRGRRVEARVRPEVPFLASLLVSTARAEVPPG